MEPTQGQPTREGSPQWLAVQDGARVYTEPRLGAPILLSMGAGNRLPVASMSNGWVHIRIGSMKGWVPAHQGQLLKQDNRSVAQTVTVSKGSTLRSGPGWMFPTEGIAPARLTLAPVAVSGSWIEVCAQPPNGGHSPAYWVLTEDVAAWGGSAKLSQLPKPEEQVQVLSSAVKPLAGKVIVLDPGHGGKDSGAIGRSGEPDQVMEKDVNLAVAQVLRAKLQAAGADVRMTRDDDTFISLAGRVKISNDAHADAFISLHQNMYPDDRSVAGTITFYEHPDSLGLAQAIETAIGGTRQLPRDEQRVEQDSLYVLRNNERPAVLVEGCYLSNPGELSDSVLPAYRENLAEGVYRGLLAYFGGMDK